MNEKEILYAMALRCIPTIGNHWSLSLYDKAGSATTLFENYKEIKDIIPDASDSLQNALLSFPEYVEQAKQELEFMDHYQIKGLLYGQDNYPYRLKDCVDAPLVLFFKGETETVLNGQRIISIVGTRKCTEYGKDLCRVFLRELAGYDPSILIVSGLAYGIDTHAHENALKNEMGTVGVLAHGLDRIYPQSNRGLASKMLSTGGLLTEYCSKTEPDAYNFVQRNRIVAGLSDCCIVVESDEKGGSLITADLAMGYHRDVFAFPGRITDQYSRGCNRLIERNEASILTSAESFLNQMRWDSTKPKVVQCELFPELTPEEGRVVDCLRGKDSLSVNLLSVQSNIPISKLVAVLLSLEMKGIVKSLVGGSYRLLS